MFPLPGTGQGLLGAAPPGGTGFPPGFPHPGAGEGLCPPPPCSVCPNSCSALSPSPALASPAPLSSHNPIFSPKSPPVLQARSNSPQSSRGNIQSWVWGSLGAAPRFPLGRGSASTELSLSSWEGHIYIPGEFPRPWGEPRGPCGVQGCSQVRLPLPPEGLGLWGLICVPEFSDPLQGWDLSSTFSGLFPGLFLM